MAGVKGTANRASLLPSAAHMGGISDNALRVRKCECVTPDLGHRGVYCMVVQAHATGIKPTIFKQDHAHVSAAIVKCASVWTELN